MSREKDSENTFASSPPAGAAAAPLARPPGIAAAPLGEARLVPAAAPPLAAVPVPSSAAPSSAAPSLAAAPSFAAAAAPSGAVPSASWQQQLFCGYGSAVLWRECVTQIALSLPISLTYLLSFALQLTSQVLVGHISASALAAASLGTVYANASGMAVIIGLTSACETLASQAFGAGNLPRVGVVAQRASAVLLAVCVPCGVAWLAAGPALRSLGQDEETVALTATYIRMQLPGLPAIAVYEVYKRTLQSVGVSAPQVVIGCAAVLLNLVVGTILVYFTPLGFLGAPLALSGSQMLMAAMILLYIRWHRRIHAALRAAQRVWRRLFGGGCRRRGGDAGEERGGGSERDAAGLAAAASDLAVDIRPLDGGGAGLEPLELSSPSPLLPAAAADAAAADAAAPPDLDDVLDAVFSLPLRATHFLSGWREYLMLGLPSALLLVTEWGSFEVGALIAGLLSTNSLAAHTVCASTAALSFMPPLGLSVACGIRIGQLCGEVDARRAKLAYAAAWTLDTAFVVGNAVFIFAVGPVWAWVFTDDADVVALTSSTIWMLALYSMFDSWQCVAAGGLRGLGLPGYGAGANVIGWVSVGLPLAYVFAIVLGWGLQGIWVGFTTAVAVTFALMTLTLARSDWHAIAVASRARALQDVAKPPADAGADAAAISGGAAASGLSGALPPLLDAPAPEVPRGGAGAAVAAGP